MGTKFFVTQLLPYHISERFTHDRSWVICLRTGILLWDEVRVVREQTDGQDVCFASIGQAWKH